MPSERISYKEARELLAQPKRLKHGSKPLWECQKCWMLYYERPAKTRKAELACKCGAKGTVEIWYFDSGKEHTRWCDLKRLEKAGQIRNLERQVAFTFEIMRETDNQHGIGIVETELLKTDKGTPIKYVADHVYEESRLVGIEAAHLGTGWAKVVEDVKSAGTRTEAYKIKKALMRAVHGILIREI